jgi:hypothetical protein
MILLRNRFCCERHASLKVRTKYMLWASILKEIYKELYSISSISNLNLAAKELLFSKLELKSVKTVKKQNFYQAMHREWRAISGDFSLIIVETLDA